MQRYCHIGIHIGNTLGEQRASLCTIADRDYKSILDTSNIGCASMRGCGLSAARGKEQKAGEREDSRHWISASCNTLSSIYICIHACTYLLRARRTRGAALGDGGCARWRTRSLIFIRAMKHGAVHSLANPYKVSVNKS